MEGKSLDPRHTLGIWTEVVHSVRLVWRLFRDRCVPLWDKAVPVVTLAYVIWPFDLLTDLLPGLGQLDDISAIVVGMTLFINICPAEIVRRHRQQLELGDAPPPPTPNGERVVDSTYRVVEETGDKTKPLNPAGSAGG
jgi:uncharacterized membrane protein YkvA (DUF1232 family)